MAAATTTEKLIKVDAEIYRTEDARFEVRRTDQYRRDAGYDLYDLTRWERFRNYRGMPQDENVNTRVYTLAEAKRVIANWREAPHGHATKEEARAWFRQNFR